ncbi:unnamed protein product (macronuclear) [Paramecium tetraurelia]|uniref:Polymerase nucleotidyl transferase domain-containing protein n=1 Tax=Paramecium tetraurelia TaxID=5888 RepID=A0BIT7_PARTE|nr:uncharacterized protein GSPATT00004826001 [Paramecium tetraurelia]CAK58454.1 unnamed protein product [Paramecium tetraurelia]|eukprot:XP_001425852.1 hypothetical protein (macronuclear) [Paramecium tetraurelia strain d4-2]
MNFLQPFNYCLYPYRHPYYYNLYADNIHEQNSSTATYKSEVISWLATLEQSELYKLFQIKGQIKTFPIMKMYIYDKLNNPSIYALLQKKTINLESKIDDQFMMNFKAVHPKAEELYSKLNIVDDENFMDTIFVAEPHLENLNSFLDLLQDLSDKYFLSTFPKTSLEKAEDPIWFHQNSFHSCTVWIIKEFEKNISFHYNLHREKKKKQRLFREPIYKNTSSELKEFFLQNLANNKERLTYYFQEIYSEIKQQPDRLENRFYENIFSGTAIKLLKSQVELLFNFQLKCHTDTNIINTMLISSMNDLVDQKTYILKKFYKIVQQLFQEHLEQELFKTENLDKKQKKDKKKKKKKFQKMLTFKGLDPIELDKRLSSKNLQESNILRFQRSYSQSNLTYTYVTPPNTPSAQEISDDLNESNKSSNTQQQSYKVQCFKNLKTNLKQTEQQSISQQFITDSDIPIHDDYIDVGQTITIHILEIANISLNDENSFKEQFLKEQKRMKKKQKGYQESIPESRDEQLQLQSPQSEITRFSIETQAQTIKSHCSNRTSSTSEEEETKQKKNQMKNSIKIKKNNNEKQKNITKLISSFKRNQFEDSQCQQDINSISNESEQISQNTLEDEITHSIQKKNQQIDKKKNLSIKPQSSEKSLKEQLENVQQKGKQKLIEQINLDILDFTDNIMSEYENMLPFRLLAFDRVKSVIQKVFLGIPDGMIMLFGSCATGLALIDSDIDIGINGLEVYNRNMLKSHFDNLFFEFTRKKWVVKANPIFNSAVPIIKLEIDPQINIFEYEGRNLDDQQIQLWKKLKQKLKSGIKVDISFNFNGNGNYPTHIGSITTDLVKKWMEEYPSLQQIVLILKSMIKKLKLSESYTGGLSSYSLIIMVYSYMREQRITSNLISEQFIDLLNFYIKFFDSSSTGIGLLANINDPNSSYFFNLQDYCLPALPITIFNPYNRKLLTHSCVQINKIFDFFKLILKELDAKQDFYCNYVVLGKKKQQKLNKSLENFIVSILEQIK